MTTAAVTSTKDLGATVKNAQIRAAVIGAIVAYCDAMQADYNSWAAVSLIKCGATETPAEAKMTFDLDIGKKFVRIWQQHNNTGRCAHSFIVLQDCEVTKARALYSNKPKETLKLRAGDILKVATWKAPALNFVRGNVLDKNYGDCKWTGAA